LRATTATAVIAWSRRAAFAAWLVAWRVVFTAWLLVAWAAFNGALGALLANRLAALSAWHALASANGSFLLLLRLRRPHLPLLLLLRTRLLVNRRSGASLRSTVRILGWVWSWL